MNILAVMPFEERHRDYLRAIAPEADFTFTTIPEVTGEQVARADIILGNVAPAMLKNAVNLKWIQLNSAGSDAYCKPGVLPEGAKLTCATGAYGLTVSEHMLTLTMMLCRKMDLYMKDQFDIHWTKEGRVTSVWGSTVLVLGLGDIGTEYARRVKALGAHVIAVKRDTSVCPDGVDELYPQSELDNVIGRADIIAMVLPSTPATRGMINSDRLARMKPTAYIINAGRGDAIDCDALNTALREGTIGGAALDVTAPEPLVPEHPLWTAPRAIITPHVAGSFFLQETFERVTRIAGENLGAYLRNEPLRNVVNPKTGERR